MDTKRTSTQASFDEEQSRILALCFMQKLAKEYANEFSEEGLNNLLKGIECCLNDPLYPEAWRETYEVAFGRSFTQKIRLTQEEVYTNLIEFCVRFIYDWDLDLSETVRKLLTIRFEFYREPGFRELRHYKKFLESIPPCPEKGPDHAVFIFKKRGVEPEFSIHQNNQSENWIYAPSLMSAYLDRLWDYSKPYFSEDGFEEFTIYMGPINGDPAFEGELLEDVYIAIFGSGSEQDSKMTTDVIFTLMIQHCAYYVYGFHIGSRELLNYLFLIRYKPQSYQYENEVWVEEIDEWVTKYGY